MKSNPTAAADEPQQAEPERPAAVPAELADLDLWVPYRKRKKDNGKTDKIPSNGVRGLSTADPDDWMKLAEAQALVQAHGLDGVGIVLTNPIEAGDYRLIGIDIDKVAPDRKPLVRGYAERSPSGNGIRQFAWARKALLEGKKDTTDIKLPGADHAEIYISTSPRFLTVTFDVINDDSIAVLSDEEFEKLPRLEKAGPPPRPLPEIEEGNVIDLSGIHLKPRHKALLAGKGQPEIDRSTVVPSLLLTLFDKHNVSREDALATMLRTPALWRYCTDHRERSDEAAVEFARKEVDKGYDFSLKAKEERLWAATVEGGDGGEANVDIWVGPEAALRPNLFDKKLEPREFIVDEVLPRTNGALIAPGGMGKSALTLWEGSCIINGLDVWNRKVLRPGGMLIATAEDHADDIDYRMQQIANEMNLSAAEKRRLLDNYFVEDVLGKKDSKGKMVRLVEKDSNGNLIVTDHVDTLIARYRGRGLSIINFDPFNLFGPGESLLNDGEAAMAAVAHHFSTELNCHVRYIKHTGQQVARENIRDQYSGRGGSAGADNMRQVMQVSSGEFKDAPFPKNAKARMELMDSAQALTVDFHKVSYGPPQNHRPALIVRAGWKFYQFEKAEPTSEDALIEDMQAICHYVRSEISKGRYPTKQNITDDTKHPGMTRNRARAVVDAAVAKGWLEKADLPENLRTGAKKEYLKTRENGDA